LDPWWWLLVLAVIQPVSDVEAGQGGSKMPRIAGFVVSAKPLLCGNVSAGAIAGYCLVRYSTEIHNWLHTEFSFLLLYFRRRMPVYQRGRHPWATQIKNRPGKSRQCRFWRPTDAHFRLT
jgi:hypothetical protein